MNEVWTFTSDSCGYVLLKDGAPQGGVGTLGTASHTGDGRVRAWQHRRADAKMYREAAKRECDKRNSKEPA